MKLFARGIVLPKKMEMDYGCDDTSREANGCIF